MEYHQLVAQKEQQKPLNQQTQEIQKQEVQALKFEMKVTQNVISKEQKEGAFKQAPPTQPQNMGIVQNQVVQSKIISQQISSQPETKLIQQKQEDIPKESSNQKVGQAQGISNSDLSNKIETQNSSQNQPKISKEIEAKQQQTQTSQFASWTQYQNPFQKDILKDVKLEQNKLSQSLIKDQSDKISQDKSKSNVSNENKDQPIFVPSPEKSPIDKQSQVQYSPQIDYFSNKTNTPNSTSSKNNQNVIQSEISPFGQTSVTEATFKNSLIKAKEEVTHQSPQKPETSFNQQFQQSQKKSDQKRLYSPQRSSNQTDSANFDYFGNLKEIQSYKSESDQLAEQLQKNREAASSSSNQYKSSLYKESVENKIYTQKDLGSYQFTESSQKFQMKVLSPKKPSLGSQIEGQGIYSETLYKKTFESPSNQTKDIYKSNFQESQDPYRQNIQEQTNRQSSENYFSQSSFQNQSLREKSQFCNSQTYMTQTPLSPSKVNFNQTYQQQMLKQRQQNLYSPRKIISPRNNSNQQFFEEQRTLEQQQGDFTYQARYSQLQEQQKQTQISQEIKQNQGYSSLDNYIQQQSYPSYTSYAKKIDQSNFKDSLQYEQLISQIPTPIKQIVGQDLDEQMKLNIGQLLPASANRLKCRICQQIYNRRFNIPKQLKCGHTYCLPCLQKQGKEQNGVKCTESICLQITSIWPPENLTTNEDIIQIAEERTREIYLMQEKTCDYHQQPILYFCFTHNIYICQACFTISHSESCDLKDLPSSYQVIQSKMQDAIQLAKEKKIKALQEKQNLSAQYESQKQIYEQMISDMDYNSKQLLQGLTKTMLFLKNQMNSEFKMYEKKKNKKNEEFDKTISFYDALQRLENQGSIIQLEKQIEIIKKVTQNPVQEFQPDKFEYLQAPAKIAEKLKFNVLLIQQELDCNYQYNKVRTFNFAENQLLTFDLISLKKQNSKRQDFPNFHSQFHQTYIMNNGWNYVTGLDSQNFELISFLFDTQDYFEQLSQQKFPRIQSALCQVRQNIYSISGLQMSPLKQLGELSDFKFVNFQFQTSSESVRYKLRVDPLDSQKISFQSLDSTNATVFGTIEFQPQSKYYFEIFVENDENKWIKIGVYQNSQQNQQQLLEFQKDKCFSDFIEGFSYFAQAETRNGSDEDGPQYGEMFGSGDTIGVFVDTINGNLGFSKNNKFMGWAFENNKIIKQGNLVPAVNLMESGQTIQITSFNPLDQEQTKIINQCERYDFKTKRWYSIKGLQQPVFGATACYLAQANSNCGSIFVIGGSGNKNQRQSAFNNKFQVYNICQDTWSVLQVEIPIKSLDVYCLTFPLFEKILIMDKEINYEVEFAKNEQLEVSVKASSVEFQNKNLKLVCNPIRQQENIICINQNGQILFYDCQTKSERLF